MFENLAKDGVGDDIMNFIEYKDVEAASGIEVVEVSE